LPLRRLFFFLVIFLLSANGFEEEAVIELSYRNFDAAIAENPLIFVEFFAPWCGHCKHLAPEYEKAAIELKGRIPFAKVNCDSEDNKPLMQRFGVQGFPTLKLFRDGNPKDYEGGRTADEIVSFLNRQLIPTISVLESVNDVSNFVNQERVVIVGFFESRDSEVYESFKTLANELRDNFLFGEVIALPTISSEFEVAIHPSIVLFKKFDEGKNILSEFNMKNHELLEGTSENGNSNLLEDIRNFINTNSVPLIDEIGPENFRSYYDSKLPLAYLFVNKEISGQQEHYVSLVHELAIETKGKLNWVYIDWKKYAKHGERLGLSGDVVPSLAIEDTVDGMHYAFNEKEELTAEAISVWVRKFLSKELLPTIKSEEIPKKKDGHVTVIVAKTFTEIVHDPSKDVLVEFFAPWCGHCKKLAPVYEEVAKTLSSVSSVLIAKIDVTANDVDPKLGIRGFPTLKFFPANAKESPIDYEGDRTEKDLIYFVKRHASIPFELDLKKSPSSTTETPDIIPNEKDEL